jgi:hypothetical protein
MGGRPPIKKWLKTQYLWETLIQLTREHRSIEWIEAKTQPGLLSRAEVTSCYAVLRFGSGKASIHNILRDCR